MTGERPDRLGTLTSTVDQLQAEVDQLRRLTTVALTVALAIGTILYTYLAIRGARA